ncbi:MAG TPA: hypothetical protein VKS21_10710, partial [Spirochaetota bacterium]|nr:hypothetical protein [Spirochaetota bacterium]
PLYQYIRKELKLLADKIHSTTELLSITGTSLLWLESVEPENNFIRVKAVPGFTRTLYELDAPARLYLNSLSQSMLARFDQARFYESSPGYRSLSKAKALKLIRTAQTHRVTLDHRGNQNSIRRYAALLTYQNKTFIITAAEADTVLNNKKKHINFLCSCLEQTGKKIMEEINEYTAY